MAALSTTLFNGRVACGQYYKIICDYRADSWWCRRVVSMTVMTTNFFPHTFPSQMTTTGGAIQHVALRHDAPGLGEGRDQPRQPYGTRLCQNQRRHTHYPQTAENNHKSTQAPFQAPLPSFTPITRGIILIFCVTGNFLGYR
ncbi:hypothetical protein KSP40_PGU006214 [Platanthera guangdongensis]|uniref:Expansin-like EG45 domain-containing protein n=1 Tax=Platanthera guangdongensis TaxID=2320717 RepID=A0ABR2M293_9ASPA